MTPSWTRRRALMAICLRKWKTGQAYLIDETINGLRVREQFEKQRDAKAFQADLPLSPASVEHH